MNNSDILRNMNLTPYMLIATSLISVKRKVGGNQFRHSLATMSILMDYKYFDDPVLLKASIVHDVIEDGGYEYLSEIYHADSDGPEVLRVVLEVTHDKQKEEKEKYLYRLRFTSDRAKKLKCADRISNLTDLHLGIYTSGKILSYLEQTEKYILPLAKDVNQDFVIEITDLIKERKELLKI